HGVMNTDNMSVAGETIDYGPCAFMDFYHPHTVYSSIDHMGRYAYGNQPPIAQWNLAQLAQCLLPIMAEPETEALKRAQAIIDGFADRFEAALTAGLRRKLGLTSAKDGDLALGQDLLKRMAENEADFTLTFRGLADMVDPAGGKDGDPRDLFNKPADFDDWVPGWRARLAEEARPADEIAAALRAANPMFIPRNHQIEAVIRVAEDNDDFGPFERLIAVLVRPFDDQPENRRYALPPRPEEVVHQTFCGT
ncbi:MAG: YdiU family protein, partial [Hyphomicrobiales bacterium]|nr:YdiU family protein [Hyphomicrobiales bacterium]